ncbi:MULTISPECIES: nitroreductase family deazaflavin-dependent oxidoreductase [Halorussus]|uniref:nitroreductase family deazaflavin-dependent oxidoreductase n=1 Tax=Halorussus TaxID=1070314 RepID=UPI000E20F976|nr:MULTISPECIES: nitroreductase family deazaflavin-dependent oxidoreductase [Halorussus]NHN58788.1 nitroreductase family deazaflavin-dependent oxidoreductase [Halorussus sp. JP-T4]
MAGETEARDRQARDRVRDVNKRYLNPAAMRLAGRRGMPYGIVRHVGRRSGERYDTPVLVGTRGDRFVVPLPYGTDTDWYRNVRAADECVVIYGGHAYRAESPRLAAPAAVSGVFPAWQRRLIERAGADQYLRMDRAEELPAEYRGATERHPAGPAVAGLAGAALAAWVLWRVARNRGR